MRLSNTSRINDSLGDLVFANRSWIACYHFSHIVWCEFKCCLVFLMIMPIGLFHPANQAIREGAEMTPLDGVVLLVISCVLVGAITICPKG